MSGHSAQSLLASAYLLELLSRIGLGALQTARVEGESEMEHRTRCARAAKNLVLRTLVFWLVGFAALTLAGLAI